ncbi:MAG: two-component system, OmpR family, phosphate regulon sensor histidine kinase PhoR [Acidobacteriota bacterium]|nr:two-component system, OmpR family, phosphate regulon sensor histidine kinase PhoR [Acidobacteriota bacterium]
MRFPPKLRLAPLWPALAAVLTASALLWLLLPGLFQRSASTQLLDTLRLLSPIVAERAVQPGADLQRWVHEIGSHSDLRITLIRGDGSVIADSSRSDRQVGAMENHSERPEIREALARGQGAAVRHSETTGDTYVYAARTLTDSKGELLVLRLAQPLSELQALRGRLAAAMLLAALAAGVAILLTSLWIDRRLFQPLARLIGEARDLVGGRLRRVQVPEEDELAPVALALNRLAETAEAQFAAVRDERDHLKAILSSMSEGVLVVGADGRARLANPAFLRLFDINGEEVTGRPILEIIRQPGLASLVDDTLRLGTGQSGQIEILAPERRTLLLASAALAGGERGAVVVARDTTELTRVADMRRDFVANVSHELKTPLAAIRGYAETLRDGALDEPATARRFNERILVQCRRLQALLDDLLTLSRLESVTPQPTEREPVELPAVIHRAAEVLSDAARERQVRIELDVDEQVPALSGDPEGIERLVVNLLDNAVKYNQPEGTVSLRLSQADGHALLEVSDTGIGIPQDALSRIFERFYRVDKGRSRDEGGTGLGLAIVKHVAQTHGGHVEVESRIGKGSTFRVRLPLG